MRRKVILYRVNGGTACEAHLEDEDEMESVKIAAGPTAAATFKAARRFLASLGRMIDTAEEREAERRAKFGPVKPLKLYADEDEP